MAEITWTASAVEDLTEIRAYIGQFNPTAATTLAARLVEAADGLSVFPNRGRLIGINRRELTIVTPYVIRYNISGNTINILRVRHGARAPE